MQIKQTLTPQSDTLVELTQAGATRLYLQWPVDADVDADVPLDALNDDTSKNKVVEKILKSPGPYTTPRIVNRSLTRRTRPNTAQVIEVMETLHQDGLGTYLEQGGAKVFIKVPVHQITSQLEQFNISVQCYESCYNQPVPARVSHGVESMVKAFTSGEYTAFFDAPHMDAS